jgi:hypothetical protein
MYTPTKRSAGGAGASPLRPRLELAARAGALIASSHGRHRAAPAPRSNVRRERGGRWLRTNGAGAPADGGFEA